MKILFVNVSSFFLLFFIGQAQLTHSLSEDVAGSVSKINPRNPSVPAMSCTSLSGRSLNNAPKKINKQAWGLFQKGSFSSLKSQCGSDWPHPAAVPGPLSVALSLLTHWLMMRLHRAGGAVFISRCRNTHTNYTSLPYFYTSVNCDMMSVKLTWTKPVSESFLRDFNAVNALTAGEPRRDFEGPLFVHMPLRVSVCERTVPASVPGRCPLPLVAFSNFSGPLPAPPRPNGTN